MLRERSSDGIVFLNLTVLAIVRSFETELNIKPCMLRSYATGFFIGVNHSVNMMVGVPGLAGQGFNKLDDLALKTEVTDMDEAAVTACNVAAQPAKPVCDLASLAVEGISCNLDGKFIAGAVPKAPVEPECPVLGRLAVELVPLKPASLEPVFGDMLGNL